jgi:hypothetical protein
MNSFIFTGRIGTVTPSTTKAGKPYFSVEIEPEGDPGRDNQYPQERIPVITSRDCSQLHPGTEVIVTGKLAGRRNPNGQYLNLQMSCADICPVPSQAPRRQPQATYDQRDPYGYPQPPPPPPPPAYRQQTGTMHDYASRQPQQPPPPPQPPAAPQPPPEYRDDDGNKIPF